MSTELLTTTVPDLQLNATDLNFDIVDSELGVTSCNMAVRARDFLSVWSAHPCNENGRYTISWGYNNATNSAVMTVCQ